MGEAAAESRETRPEENAMVSRRLISFALTLTLGAAGLPALAQAEAAPAPLRASIDRALTAPVPASAPAAPCGATSRAEPTAGAAAEGEG
jgi:hypothetical protein